MSESGLRTLDREFRYHFGDDEDAAGRVFDAWTARRLELFKRSEVYGDDRETRRRMETLGVERFVPDDEPIPREGFVRQFCGGYPRPTHGQQIARILVDREHFAAWVEEQSKGKPGRPVDTPDEKVAPLVARWKGGELGQSFRQLDDAIMEACGVTKSTAREARRRFGVGQGLQHEATRRGRKPSR